MSAGIHVLLLAAASLFCTVDPGALVSGPQVGKYIPGLFIPLVVVCPELPNREGKKSAIVEWYESSPGPIVMIFARQFNDPLAMLIQKLDLEIGKAKAKGEKKHAFVVMLSKDAAMERSLKAYGEHGGLQNVTLAMFDPPGPKYYKLAEEAEVTVIIYAKITVIANYTFRKGHLTEKSIDSIVSSLRSK